MKKVIVVLFFLCFLCNSAMAKYCFNCGAKVSVEAKFCSNCGAKQQIDVQQTKNSPTLPHISLEQNNKPNNNTKYSYQSMKKRVINLFALVDEFGKHIRGFKYLNVVGNFPDYKIRLKKAIKLFNRIKARLPRELQIYGEASIAKSSSFFSIVKVMRSFGINFGYKDSIIKAASIEIALYNAIVNEIRRCNTPYTQDEINIVEQKFYNIKKKMRLHRVTSKYLKVGLDKLVRNSSFIVLSVKKRSAQILCIGESQTSDLVEGKVSLRSLEKRTTWKKVDASIYK